MKLKPEEEIQRRCVNWFKYRYHTYWGLLFHVPNEGTESRIRGEVMKMMGRQPGVADLLLLVPMNGFHGLCLEAKTKTGRQSPAQKEWQSKVEGRGYQYKIFRSLEEFIEICHDYLGPEDEDMDIATLRRIQGGN